MKIWIKWGGIALVGIGLGVGLGMVFEDTTPKADVVAIEQVGYFKSDERQRVLSYRSERQLTADEARALLDRLPWTAGKLTRAHVYSGAATVPRWS